MAGFIRHKKEHTFYFMEVINMATFRKYGKGWQARISWYDDDGKRHYTSKAGFKTKMDAKAYALELEQKKQDKTIVTKSISLVDYYKEWFETYKKDKVAPITADRYNNIYRLLKRHFGNKKIDKVSRRDYQLFINDFGSAHAPDTVKKTNSIIRSCVKSAIIDKLLVDDFTQNIELKWNDSKKMSVDYLSVQEIEKLASTLQKQLNPKYTSHYMILTAIYTGMRLQEIAGLKWEDINFNWHTISINKAWNYKQHKLTKTKTESSVRVIKINDILLDALAELKDNHREFVFENSQGNIPSSNGVNKTLRRVLKMADIDRPNYHFHSLRHSHVALLLYYGIELYPISKRLGHSNMNITAQKYAYLIDELKQKSDSQIIDLLDNLGNKKDAPNRSQKTV